MSSAPSTAPTSAPTEAVCSEIASAIRWYEGNAGAVVAWHGRSALAVWKKKRRHPLDDDPSLPLHGYDFALLVSDRLSHLAKTLPDALRAAIERVASNARPETDDPRNGDEDRRTFLARNGVIEGVTPSRTLVDYLDAELAPADPEPLPDAPGARHPDPDSNHGSRR